MTIVVFFSLLRKVRTSIGLPSEFDYTLPHGSLDHLSGASDNFDIYSSLLGWLGSKQMMVMTSLYSPGSRQCRYLKRTPNFLLLLASLLFFQIILLCERAKKRNGYEEGPRKRLFSQHRPSHPFFFFCFFLPDSLSGPT